MSSGYLRKVLSSSSSMALTHMEAVCCTASCSLIPDFSFNTLQTNIEANCGRLERTLSKSMSQPTSRLYCVRSIQPLGTENIPVQQSTTILPQDGEHANKPLHPHHVFLLWRKQMRRFNCTGNRQEDLFIFLKT